MKLPNNPAPYNQSAFADQLNEAPPPPPECSPDQLPDDRLTVLVDKTREAAKQAFAMDVVSRDAAKMSVNAAVTAGELLKECKKIVGHGKWERWRSEHFPEISQETACRWMRLANLSRVTDLSGAESLSHAYRLCEILPDSDGGKQSEPSAAVSPSKASSRSAPQEVLRASSNLQKQMRLLVQKHTPLTDSEKNQIKLLWKEIEALFNQIIKEAVK